MKGITLNEFSMVFIFVLWRDVFRLGDIFGMG